jgi:hypothetical protein
VDYQLRERRYTQSMDLCLAAVREARELFDSPGPDSFVRKINDAVSFGAFIEVTEIAAKKSEESEKLIASVVNEVAVRQSAEEQ